MKTLITAVVLMGAIAVGTFSAFKYGFVDKAKEGASAVVEKALGAVAGDEETASTVSVSSEPAEAVVGIVRAPVEAAAASTASTSRTTTRPAAPSSLRPPEASIPSPAPAVADAARQVRETQQARPVAGTFVPAAVTVAQATLPKPETAAPVTPAPARSVVQNVFEDDDTWVASGTAVAVTDIAAAAPTPPRAVSAAQAQAQMQALAQQRAQQAEADADARSRSVVREDISAMSAPAVTAVPVLSEVKTRIRAIDQLLASNPAEALKQIEALQAMPLEPDDAAETGYRRGYVARLLHDEANAERAWRETADAYPALRGGRFSALALGDTLYHRYAGDRPQTTYWDDIQLLYSRALGRDDAPFLPDAVKAQVKEKLRRINDAVFFGSAPSKLARYHTVEPGELLSGIANRFRVDYESIARINGIDPNRIRAGMDLKLVVGEVDVVVRKHSTEPDRQPTLTWFLDGRWMREYDCCVGDGAKTPAGTYTFTSKERDPSWTNPVNGQLLPNHHPENILGSRWMAMRGMNTQGLGIHGTTVDDSIPGYTSAGCVRLLNRDVEELFSFARIGGRVTIIE